MQHVDHKMFEMNMAGMRWGPFCEALEQADPEDGFVERLGSDHVAVLLENKPVLLITFESLEQVQALSAQGRPMGWQMAEALGWSHLALMSHGETWFRDRRVIGFFDRLIDDGFFEEFDQVIFYGCGPAGYAAAAFSVAAPGAQVLALQPQATLDPRLTEWDDRYRHMRRTDFTARFGYAPDMLDAARAAFVFYDPEQELDAVHAALFNRLNVRLIKTRHLGGALDRSFKRMNVLYRLLAHISAGKMSPVTVARLLRARRDDPGYQFSLLQHLKETGRDRLLVQLCDVVLTKRNARPFAKARAQALAALSATPEGDGEAEPPHDQAPQQGQDTDTDQDTGTDEEARHAKASG